MRFLKNDDEYVLPIYICLDSIVQTNVWTIGSWRLMATLTIKASPGACELLPPLQGTNLSPVSAPDNKQRAVNRHQWHRPLCMTLCGRSLVWPALLLSDNYRDWWDSEWMRKRGWQVKKVKRNESPVLRGHERQEVWIKEKGLDTRGWFVGHLE